MAVGGVHAAVLHGLPTLVVPATVHVHGAGHPSTSHRHLGMHRVVRAQAVGDVITVDGMRITSLERTAIDCARHLPIDEAVVIVDAVLHRLADPEPWRRADGDRRIARHKRRLLDMLNAEARTPGNARARAVIELADGWAESAMESLLHRAIEVVGLQRPILQASVVTRRGRFFADALLEGISPDKTPWRLVVEADGQEKWARPADLQRHREREEEIRRTGAAFLSVRWSMVRQTGLSDLTELFAASVPAHVRERMQAVDRWKTPTEREAGLAMERPGFWQH